MNVNTDTSSQQPISNGIDPLIKYLSKSKNYLILLIIKGKPKAKVKNYHSIVGIGRGGGKSFSSYGAVLWLLETFQTTFTPCFVSNFEFQIYN